MDTALSAKSNPPRSAVASGLLHGQLGGEADSDEDDAEGKEARATLSSHEQPRQGKFSQSSPRNTLTLVDKKKKKNSSNKKKKRSKVTTQTTPPRIALAKLFPDQFYPDGEIVQYTDKDENSVRTTAEEVRHLAALNDMDDDFLRDYRKAAEVHRQVRKHAQTIAKPGITMSELALEIEEGVRALTGHQGTETGDALKAGMGFPTGLCLNNVAAHWTPNAGNKEVVLQYDDVLKVDFGVHVNGRIVDSAFTVAANPVYDNLLEAVMATTNTGLKVRTTHLDLLWCTKPLSGSWCRRSDRSHERNDARSDGKL